MSAAVLALAVGAAEAFARRRGPWSVRHAGMEVSRDPLTRDGLLVGRTLRSDGTDGIVPFKPLPPKEVAMPTPPPEARSWPDAW